MKFTKLFTKIQECFEKDETARDKEKEEKLAKSLDEKIDSIKKKLKDTSSVSKTIKLKKKLDILVKFKEKMS